MEFISASVDGFTIFVNAEDLRTCDKVVFKVWNEAFSAPVTELTHMFQKEEKASQDFLAVATLQPPDISDGEV